MAADDARQRPEGPTIRRLLSVVRPHLGSLLLATGLLALLASVAVAAPRLAGLVVDAALVERNVEQLDLIAIVLVGIFAVRALLVYSQTYLLRATGARILRDLRSRVFSHLVIQAPDFYENRRIGELLSRLGSDLERVQGTLTNTVPEGVRATLTLIGTLGFILFMNAELTVVALAALAPIPVVAFVFGRRLQRLSTDVQDSLADSASVAEEALSGIRTVQSFGREAHERDRYSNGLTALLGLQLSAARLSGGFYAVLGFIGFTAFSAVLWYGGRLVVEDQLSPGELTAFLLYLFAIAGSISALGSLYAGLRELRGAAARTFEILDTTPSIEDSEGAAPLVSPEGRLTLNQIGYRYPSAEEHRFALREIDVDIAPGEVVALVGPSGAGKSTLFSLLLRFDDPTEGHVAMDGHPVRELTVESVRNAFAVVPQEIFLFSGTVADNIRYGHMEASDEEVRAAATAAGVDRFIDDLENGYEQLVGERGVKLSAGQRQRIAIARAFLARPTILLLDEATSALDADSEAVVQDALAELMRGRTTLVIAHRLATARNANRILVLDGGRVVDSGTHDALHARCDLYRRYWELQSLQSDTGAPRELQKSSAGH